MWSFSVRYTEQVDMINVMYAGVSVSIFAGVSVSIFAGASVSIFARVSVSIFARVSVSMCAGVSVSNHPSPNMERPATQLSQKTSFVPSR